jgi:hypothetical protein
MRRLFIFCLVFGFPLILSAQQLHFRTDGYYFWDNKIDTLYLARVRDKENAELIKMLNDNGFKTNAQHGDPCVPDNTIPYSGSSHVKVLSFFSDVIGTNTVRNCWNIQTYNKIIPVLKNRMAGKKDPYFKEQSLRVRLYRNNTFVIDAGESFPINRSA